MTPRLDPEGNVWPTGHGIGAAVRPVTRTSPRRSPPISTGRNDLTPPGRFYW
jgi:hypothetical protein